MVMRRSLVQGKRIALLAAAFILTHCACGSNRRDEPALPPPPAPVAETAPPAPQRAPIDLPSSLNTGDLDSDEKALLKSILDTQYDPCGQAQSFAASLAAAAPCPLAQSLADLAVAKIAQGLSKNQVLAALHAEQARQASKMEFDLEGSPTVGTKTANSAVIVEFFDYQCPHCRLASEPTQALAKRTGAVIYYKMMPLSQHPIAREAARLALAANRQGKFLPVHEALFNHQDTLDAARLHTIAQEAGLDLAALDRDLADPTLDALIVRDLAESDKAKLTGTPTFFVNGFETPFDQLEAAVTAP